jgi:hypothetical protein
VAGRALPGFNGSMSRLPGTFHGMGAVEFVSIALPAVFWPLIVGLIAFWQRKPIGRFIDRIRGWRAFGQELDVSPPSGLAGAVEGGASSPEVQKVIRSVSTSWATLAGTALHAAENAPPSDEESSDGKVAEPSQGDVSKISQAWLERLEDAQRIDEARRRSEIERVMQSAAGWGARFARARPDDVDDWIPIVRWKEDGEPEIVAIRGRDALDKRHREMWQAELKRQAAVAESQEAQRDLDSARRALHESSEPNAELQERVALAEQRAIQTRARMEDKLREWHADLSRP